MNEDQQLEQPIEPGAAGAPEGAVAEPTADDVAALYKELGIKAAAPTGAAKGRPKTAAVRAKDAAQKGAGDSSARQRKDDNDESQPQDAPAASKNGGAGNKADQKGTQDDKAGRKVQDEPDEADEGVRAAQSRAKDDSERGSEEDAERGDSGAGQEAHESDDAAQEGEDAEGKRPGKSNPKIEQRFQRLTSEVREKDQEIAELRQKLEQTMYQQSQQKVAQEDPEYTIDDFRRVRDEQGNIIDLDPERAELAWRRWKDGYEQRQAEREAQYQREQAEVQRREQMSEQIMRDSVTAYDTLAGLMDDFPELVSSSGQFDESFAAQAMPIINEAIIYAPGTEPGNPDGNAAVIVGLNVNPKRILAAMKSIREEKRALPLNGIDDNVESRSNVNVPHGRSSDPTIRAANDLYRQLNIDKRL